MSETAYRRLLWVGLVLVGLIALAGQIDIPGVNRIVRPTKIERGVGSKCAQGDRAACHALADALCKLRRFDCHKPIPERRRGGGGSTGNPHNPPGSPMGGGLTPATPRPSTAPAPPPNTTPAPPPPTTTMPSPPPTPPTPPPPAGGIVRRVCHLTPLGQMICELVRGL